MTRRLSIIVAIASHTLRDAIRNKVLYVLLFFALLLIGMSTLLASLSYVETGRILQGVAFSAIRLFGAAIAIFVGVSLIHREVDRRTIFTILSKPVSRVDFLLGKYLGLLATLWLMLAAMSAGFVVVCLAADAPLTSTTFAALAAVGMELAVLISIATLFSCFATPFLAACYSVGLYVIGHLTRDLRAIGEASDSEAIASATTWLHRMLPDLESFNWTLEASNQLPIPGGELGWAMAMGLAWCIAFLTVAALIFERRDFR